ncbi:MAG: Ppx/GppA phosphatase family protein [Sandaracinaceae bacterium]|nr:Ppx/GppA phosphatase family protein [Sandaracinaceae bacterium]
MPRMAAIDVGSNASRLLIAEPAGEDDFRVLYHDRIPVRLGHQVFITGKLAPSAIEACVEAMRAFKLKMEEHGVEHHRAVVTASARDAENADELIDRVRDLGIALEAIDGSEEARLVKLAISRRIPLEGKRALLVDLGGGSLELSEVRHDEVRYSTSLPIGTVRLLESFLDNGQPVSEKQYRLLVEYIDRILQPVADDFLRRSYDVVAAAGGNFEAIAALCPGPPGLIPSIDVRKAHQLLQRMKAMSAEERMQVFQLRPDRADVIVPALCVLDAVAHIARTDLFLVPGVGVREGIIYDLLCRKIEGREPQFEEPQSVRAAILLGRRYHFDEAHATQVDRLACQLFDALAPIHGLPRSDRLLLRVASLLHDVGDFIEYAGHHKHTQYIIEHSEILGLSRERRLVVACIARYHRRAPPSAKHQGFARLNEEEKEKVKRLSAILRIADALDRGHRSKVQHLEVTLGSREITILVSSREDLSLELWTSERKGEYFEKLFRRKLRFLAERRD